MSSQKDPRAFACVLCWQRKLKCDHDVPCSNCIKAKAHCTPRAPTPARKRRRVNHDLQERLAQLESLLQQHAGTSPLPAGQGSSTPDPLKQQSMSMRSDLSTGSHPTPENHSPQRPVHVGDIGRMMKDDAGLRFMDSYILAAILENLAEIRHEIETNVCDENGRTGCDSVNIELDPERLLNGSEANKTQVHQLQPEPAHAIRLWHLYLERVNPLLKVTHIPTLQPYVMEGAASIQSVPLNYQALLFAIYSIGTISLSEVEACQMLGMTREKAIQRFTTSLKKVLAQLDFVRNYDMVVLQALVLYVTALQGRYDRHATWVLSGTVLRIAQKMGYHRDGEALNLPPFETEMRRRIWWQIITNDIKFALISGLNRSLFPLDWDTKRPSNVNDADLYPGLTEPVRDRDGPTEMAFVLVIAQITEAMTRIVKSPGFDAAIAGRSLDYANGNEALEAANLQECRAIVRDLDLSVQEIENRFLDSSAGKAHAAALTIRPNIISKALELLEPAERSASAPEDRLMRMLISNLENTAICQESMGKHGFLWAPQAHFNCEVLSVLNLLLAERPDSPLAYRAWKAIEVCYHQQLGMQNTSQKAYNEQAILTLKAWQAWVQTKPGAGSQGHEREPEFIVHLKAGVHAYDLQSHPQSSSNPPPNVTNPPSQLDELDALLSGYFDISHFQQRDGTFVTAPTNPPAHIMPVPDLAVTVPGLEPKPPLMTLDMRFRGANRGRQGCSTASVNPSSGAECFSFPNIIRNAQP